MSPRQGNLSSETETKVEDIQPIKIKSYTKDVVAKRMLNFRAGINLVKMHNTIEKQI